MTTPTPRPRTLAIVSAGMSEPSSSRLLADRLAQKTLDLLRDRDIDATVTAVDLRDLAAGIGRASATGHLDETLRPAVDRLATADAIIAATPVYKAGMSGLFKSFIDVLDNDLLVAKPVALAATAGSARHALVPDEQMRPLFAYMRALPIPTSLFAAAEDWGDPALGQRIRRAATELAALVASDVTSAVVGGAWNSYQHQFGSAARPSHSLQGPWAGIDFDSDLMRLAAGGLDKPRP